MGFTDIDTSCRYVILFIYLILFITHKHKKKQWIQADLPAAVDSSPSIDPLPLSLLSENIKCIFINVKYAVNRKINNLKRGKIKEINKISVLFTNIMSLLS